MAQLKYCEDKDIFNYDLIQNDLLELPYGIFLGVWLKKYDSPIWIYTIKEYDIWSQGYDKNKVKELSLKILRNKIKERVMQEVKKDRPTKHQYYINIAKVVASRSTCIRRKYGSIVVKNDTIIATGYNGTPRGIQNCCDLGECERNKLNIPAGERYELCKGSHSEQNALQEAGRKNTIGATIYLYGEDAITGEELNYVAPCLLCEKMLFNGEVEKVIGRKDGVYKEIWVKSRHGYIQGNEVI